MELTYAWVLTAALLSLTQQHHAYSISSTLGPTAEEGPLAQLAHGAHERRVKRCSCESHKDKECVYFCHIGIVWINTPDQVVPYGVGSVNSFRVRRELGRCRCSNAHDAACTRFCSALQRRTHTRGENSGSVERETAKQRKKHMSALSPARNRPSLDKHQT